MTKFLIWITLKACADNKCNVAKKIISYVFDMVENIIGKAEYAAWQLFLHFPQCFLKFSVSRLLKLQIV